MSEEDLTNQQVFSGSWLGPLD